MKRIHGIKARKYLNDRGFSLVELIISIAILVIIMLPLMGNFIRSMQMNKRSEKYQVQSNLAASVMEGIKTYTIEEIIRIFNGSEELFELVPNDIDSITPLKKISENEYEEISISDEQDTYYFAINGIKAEGSAYDVLIRLDTTSYEKEVTEGGDTRGILNKYNMPELINIDKKVNGILFSNGATVQDYIQEISDSIPIEDIDQKVLDLFVAQGVSFANTTLYQSPAYDAYKKALDQYKEACKQATMRSEPTPVPPTGLIEPTLADNWELLKYTLPAELIKKVTKNMRISISDNPLGGSIVEYEIEYICDFADGVWDELRITHFVNTAKYDNTLENVYLSYEQSIFHDIHVENSFMADRVYIENKSTDNGISFFLIDKNNFFRNPINVELLTGGTVNFFTDVDNNFIDGVAAGDINKGLIKDYHKDRIFDITIEVYKTVADISNRYKEVYYSLNSAKER